MSDGYEPALVIEHLEVSVGARAIIREVSLELARGTSLAILGASGAGKSMLMAAVLGEIKPSAGRIWVDGQECTEASDRAMSLIRRHQIGVAAGPEELVPNVAPLENVALAALRNGVDAADCRARAKEILARIGLPTDGIATEDLSLGDQRRVAVARALINRPPLILADEPVGSLDLEYCARAAAELCTIPDRWPCALLVFTRMPEVAAQADRTLLLDAGVLRPYRTPATPHSH